MPASGSPAARWVLARRISVVTYQGDSGDTPARASLARPYCSSFSSTSAETSRASTRSGRIWVASRAWTRATRADSSLLSASARVRNASAAPSRAAVIWSKGTSSPAASRARRSRSGASGTPPASASSMRAIASALAAHLGEDLGVGDDRRAVEVQRPVGTAGEDLLGRDEVAGEGEGEGLVILAVGGERVVAAHRVEASPGRRGSPGGRPRSSRRRGRRAAGSSRRPAPSSDRRRPRRSRLGEGVAEDGPAPATWLAGSAASSRSASGRAAATSPRATRATTALLSSPTLSGSSASARSK